MRERLLRHKPPEIGEVLEYGAEKAAPHHYCVWWHNYWRGRGWLKRGRQIDWKPEFSERWARDRTDKRNL